MSLGLAAACGQRPCFTWSCYMCSLGLTGGYMYLLMNNWKDGIAEKKVGFSEKFECYFLWEQELDQGNVIVVAFHRIHEVIVILESGNDCILPTDMHMYKCNLPFCGEILGDVNNALKYTFSDIQHFIKKCHRSRAMCVVVVKNLRTYICTVYSSIFANLQKLTEFAVALLNTGGLSFAADCDSFVHFLK